jgi:hypothetical protein
MENEDALHTLKPAGSLKGVPQDLSLMIFLDSTKNAVAIKEAYNRNIPTIAIVNTSQDMSHVRGLCRLAIALFLARTVLLFLAPLLLLPLCMHVAPFSVNSFTICAQGRMLQCAS